VGPLSPAFQDHQLLSQVPSHDETEESFAAIRTQPKSKQVYFRSYYKNGGAPTVFWRRQELN
jgi:hypothetical protein